MVTPCLCSQLLIDVSFRSILPQAWPLHKAIAAQGLRRSVQERCAMSLGTILLIILILILLGAIPTWPHSRGWGYFPSGIVGLLLVFVLILLLLGRL
jgi:hypothetical protein